MAKEQLAPHTPEPWAYDNNGEIWGADRPGEGRPLCEMIKESVRAKFQVETDLLLEANACLMAASPELLTALSDIDAMPFSAVNDSESLQHTIRTMQMIARKAILKATTRPAQPTKSPF